ncbi:hypothetical protein BTO02_27415 [Paraburkholderia sp. SOS3]|jgi:hypothetical protein|nr:hypothetical protein BTO02_27415 [Paraburkholderia sp. SOS3]
MRIQVKDQDSAFDTTQPARPGSGSARAAAEVTESGGADRRALRAYPNAVQMAPRFLLLEQHALAIQQRMEGGAQLSIGDGEVLKLYDELRERLAFLRPGPPVANARVAGPQPRLPRPDPPATPAQPAGATAKGSEPPKAEYVGGLAIKSDYSLKEVLGTTVNALKAPFASFISSAKDLVKKAVQGEALTAEEEEEVYRYAGIVDAAASITKKGNLSQLAGSVLESLNGLIDGQTIGEERLASDLTAAYKVVDPKVAVNPGSRPSTGANAANPARLPRLPDAPGNRTPGQDRIHPFDFPRFRVTFPVPGPESSAPRIVHKIFNPPTRLPSGQIGYPLSPTRPPRLPDRTSSEPAAGPGRESTEQTGSARSRVPSVADAAQAGPSTVPPPKPPRRGSSDLKRIAGKGPVNLEVPPNEFQERMRVDDFRTRFYFYRNDRDVNDMDGARPLRKTDYDERRDVLLVGSGEHVTSYVANSKFSAGKHWGGGPATYLQGAEVIELGNGRQGVGAIRLPFDNLRRGSTVIVSGGAMNGCSMLFASDQHSLYAYHAGAAESSQDWLTSQQGAKSIVDAHVKIGPSTHPEYKWRGDNTDLVTVGRQYPFSALIYSGRSMDSTEALAAAGAALGAVGGAADTSANAYLNVQRHEYGPRQGLRWHMMTFNYHEHDPHLRTIGTAEAVISKDLKGAVTVSVLAEKGTLDRGSSIGERGGPISYRYKTTDSDSATYYVPAPPGDETRQTRPKS